MTDDEIRLVVQGAPNSIDVHALRDAAAALVEFLQGSTSHLWVVSRLAIGSLDLGARPAELTREEVAVVFRGIVQGLGAIEGAGSAPIEWRDNALKGLADLGQVRRTSGVTGLELRVGQATIPVTETLIESARRILDAGVTSFGSVTGRIDRFKSRGGSHEFGLIDPATNGAVTVKFKRRDEARVKDSIGRTVTAWGPLTRSPDGRKRSLLMEDLEVLSEPAARRIGVDEVLGLYGEDWTGGLGSVEWTRGQRDE